MQPVSRQIALLPAGQLHISGIKAHLLALLRHCDRQRYHFSFIGPLSNPFKREAEVLGAVMYPWTPRWQLDLRAIRSMAALLQTADIIYIPSRSENMSRVVLEALSIGYSVEPRLERTCAHFASVLSICQAVSPQARRPAYV